MATQSPNPPSHTAQNPDLTKLVDGNGQAVKQEAVNDTSDRPFLAPSEPMREDQVQNAVKFLSHPKVRGSPVMYRRSFLERKGLTKEEIDEAFRRVPDPASNAASVGSSATSVGTTATNQAASLQPQAPINPPVPAAAPISSNSVVPIVNQSRFHWSHALIAAGALAASGAGTALFIKSIVVPRLRTWIRKVVAEENESKKEDESQSALAEQTAEAAKAAATAAAVVAKASEELLNSKQEERKYFEAFMGMMDVQVKEMKTMGEAIRKLETAKENNHSKDKEIEEYIRSSVGNGTTNNSWRTQVVQPDSHLSSAVTKEVKVNGTSSPDNGAVRPSSAPATVEPTTAPHSKSYMEIMAMIQRGEKPPNIREIDDTPPNPNQQPSKPLLAPKPKPWEVSGISEENGSSFHSNGTNHVAPAEPWWRKKTVKITEVEPEAEQPRVPVQRGWVPPQPPSVAIPESAVAIRQPKSAPQKQQSGEIARSDDGEENNTSRAETASASEGDVTGEAESSGSALKGSYQDEIEEEREIVVEI